MALEPAFYDPMWAQAKRHEFRRRFLTGTPVSWLVILNAPTSALAAVVDLAPAIVDEPHCVADLAERARPGNGASVYAYLRDQPHGYAMPITRVREYPAWGCASCVSRSRTSPNRAGTPSSTTTRRWPRSTTPSPPTHHCGK
jgi:hypothetical protein